ncbi:hypothetical protein BDY17DRAFT_326436 [Neohortaea acidophila]|uniref:Uncharacterized protein n=1 Tax=Neohortaea acidophila TaxID=245834 RepID=A0A6A6PLH3_9PEZI|nr:uncharacterized protein BDY17DRAFT_326436 [Neohortaea acidophila]KAF2480541.1 hypothetical protein BDY17DRAFT_326436 [Neohortaea acidophila]
MGRPSGAPFSGRQRYPQDWELRDLRFEEIESDDDDYGHGVLLNPKSRDSRARDRLVSDELYFDGYDLGRDRLSKTRGYYGDEGVAYQAAVRDKENALIHTALERIARARAKGKTNVNLSEEEMDALERSRDQQPEASRSALASPPPTPAKQSSKAKASGRSASATNLSSKTRKRSSGFFGSSTSPTKSSGKTKGNRTRSSGDHVSSYARDDSPRLIEGPNGVPVYAPSPGAPYYGQELLRIQSESPKSSSRPSSKQKHQRRRESSPPDRADSYPQYPPPRHPYYYNSNSPYGLRPESSESNRSLPDDENWRPPPAPAPRQRSASNGQYIARGPAAEYDFPPRLPAAQSRRNFSGPPDVRYAAASVPRPPLPSSNLAGRPIAQHSSHSDPSIAGGPRRVSALSREVRGERSSSSSSSSGEEDEEDEDGEDRRGVEVELMPAASSSNGNSYSIKRVPVPSSAPVSGNEGRRRKSGRR